MINLLPEERKTDLGSSRANLIIARYIGIVVLAVLFLMAALATSQSVLKSTMQSAENIIATNDLKADVYSETAEQVRVLESQLTDTKTILNQEVRFSEILVKLGQIMPEGAVVGELTFDEKSLNGSPSILKVYTKNNTVTSQVQNSLQSSRVFERVSLQGTEDGQGIDGYPIAVSISVSLGRSGGM